MEQKNKKTEKIISIVSRIFSGIFILFSLFSLVKGHFNINHICSIFLNPEYDFTTIINMLCIEKTAFQTQFIQGIIYISLIGAVFSWISSFKFKNNAINYIIERIAVNALMIFSFLFVMSIIIINYFRG